MSLYPGMYRYKCIQDPIFQQIELSELEMRIIDTPEFQSLQHIAQLSNAQYVFRSANHTRFVHSLQVCFLAGEMLYHLQTNFLQRHHRDLFRTKNFAERVAKCLRIAGLVHDIGHVVLGHTFDDIASDLGICKEMQHHESRGETLFRHMCLKYKLDLNSDEIRFICEIIKGKMEIRKNQIHTKFDETMCIDENSFDTVEDDTYPDFLFEIVANHFCELDVDKFAYLTLDSFSIGLNRKVQTQRIFHHAHVVNNHIVYHEKIAPLLYDVLDLRKRMHMDVYQHKATVRIGIMHSDVLRLIFKRFDLVNLINKYAENDFAWRQVLTDQILYVSTFFQKMNLMSDLPRKNIFIRTAFALSNDIESRKLYEKIDMITSTDSSSAIKTKIEEGKLIMHHISCSHAEDNDPANFILCENEEGKLITLKKTKFMDGSSSVFDVCFKRDKSVTSMLFHSRSSSQ